MTKSKLTKRALLVSVLSMMLCLSMLVGSTFAWFTDSVTSGKNKISAGNLDVELYTRNEENEYVPVDENKSLFDENALWEPGYTQVVYLKVKNAGSLALKYQFSVTVDSETSGKNMKGDTFKLSDYLVFGQAVGTAETAYATREEARNAAGETRGLKEFSKENEKLIPGAEEYIALIVYMPTDVDNVANYRDQKPEISLGVTLSATQASHEADSFGDTYDAAAEYEMGSSARVDALVQEGYVKVEKPNDLRNAVNNGEKVVLTQNVNLSSVLKVGKDTTIDLNGYALKASFVGTDALRVTGGNVTVRNGTIESASKPVTGISAVHAIGSSNVTIENCTIKTNSNQSFAVVTNGAESLDTTIVVRNSTISAPTVAGKKGYALYAPAGDVSFINCNVTGHVFISGGNVTLDGGTYTATGFNGQDKIWHKQDTIDYVSGMAGGTANNMGDSIFIADRRSGYALSSLTIRNITFNTQIPVGTSYAIKYVDMNKNGAANRVNYVIENNTFNQQIDGKDPVMYIDLAGNDLVNP